jgi:hypothetical protein
LLDAEQVVGDGRSADFEVERPTISPPAIRKASRVDVGLIGVMKKGDTRIRFRIPMTVFQF